MANSIRFDERKSGLVRQLGSLDTFLVNVFGYALGLAITVNPVFIGGFAPSASIYGVLTLGLVAALFNGFTYGLFAALMPKTGGDYVYVTRTLGPMIGFITSVGFTVGQIYGLSLDCTWTFTQAVAPSLTTYGLLTSNAKLLAWASALAGEGHALLASIAFMLILLFVSFLGLRFTKRLFIIVFVFALLGTLLQAYAFFSIDQAQFQQMFNHFMSSSHSANITYQQVVQLGKENGIAVDHKRMIADSVRALPLGFLMFLGFTYSTYMGSEVKEGKTQLIGIFSALGFGFILFSLVMGRYMHVVGASFNAALATSAVSSQMPAGTSLTFFAGIILQNKWLNLLMNVGNFLWFALVPLVILQVCSRNIQVWAIDCLLPERFMNTNRRGVPYNAGFLTAAMAVGISLICYFRSSYTPIGAVAVVAVSVLVSGYAALIYPIAHKEEFDRAPVVARAHIAGIPALQVAGAGSIAIFLWILYASLFYPEVSGSSSRTALALVALVYMLASVYFLFTVHELRKKLSRQGLTLEEIWGTLPKD